MRLVPSNHIPQSVRGSQLYICCLYLLTITVLEILLHPPTVLFLYDLKYAWPPCSQVNNHDTVELGSDAEIKWISYLLDLSDEWLKQALTSKVTVSLLLAILFSSFIKACDVQCNSSEL